MFRYHPRNRSCIFLDVIYDLFRGQKVLGSYYNYYNTNNASSRQTEPHSSTINRATFFQLIRHRSCSSSFFTSSNQTIQLCDFIIPPTFYFINQFLYLLPSPFLYTNSIAPQISLSTPFSHCFLLQFFPSYFLRYSLDYLVSYIHTLVFFCTWF